MELNVTYTNKKHETITTSVDSFASTSVFWKSVAGFIREAAVPSVIKATSENNGSAVIALSKSGKGVEGLTATVCDNTVDLSNSPFSEKYLLNGEKAYVLSPVTEDDGTVQYFKAVYGNSNDVLAGKGKSVKHSYPIAEYWAKYYEKLAKGYKDRSRDVRLNKKVVEDNETGKELFNALLEQTMKNLPTNILAGRSNKIEKLSLTEAQIAKAWKVFRQLKKAKRTRTFQAVYKTLISLLPKTQVLPESVSSADMGKDSRIFTKIHDVLTRMENIAAAKSTFAECGITITEATAEEKATVMATLPSDLADRVEAVYAVHNPAHEARFKAYCERRHITETKLLWHGSKNENWLSIVKNSLKIHPNAEITGKMFGDGIYFAPEAKKSYNYTSCEGTYWAHGRSSFGIMGLFTTAYGTPSHDSDKLYRMRSNADFQKTLTRMGCDCLHALASRSSLRFDEIVFYHEDAINLSYLLKIRS